MEKTKSVMCKSCNKQYDEAFPGGELSNQGKNCASEVDGVEIRGHYGSSVIDTQVWFFSKNKPDWVMQGVICDSCIAKLQKRKTIKLDTTRTSW